jgi:uncharacterized protein YbjT (DUF2867 family)
MAVGLALLSACVTARSDPVDRDGVRRERVLVTGATGGTGRRIVAALLQRGYRVRAISRDPSRAGGVLGPDVEILQADLRERASLDAAVRGMSRIVSAAGAGTLDEADPNGPRAVDFEGLRNLVEAARGAKIRQFVLVSSQNVSDPDRYGMLPMRPLLRWKLRGEDALRSSGLVYTIVRPGQLLDGDGGSEALAFAQGDTLKGAMTRGDLARVCVEALGRDAAFMRTFEVASRKLPSQNDFDALFGSLHAN